MLDKLWLFLAQGFGSGRLPKMPGTWGTVAAIPLFLILHELPPVYYITVALIFTFFGCWLCGVASKQLGMHDDPSIVWDEIVGFLWVMLFVPATWEWILLAFFLFRLFDIWKPWPIAWADKQVRGGTGVMLDDLIAALYTWIILQIVLKLV